MSAAEGDTKTAKIELKEADKKQEHEEISKPASDEAKLETKTCSANDWEHADLGDASRKDKFLKLMGAAKGEHKGKIVIGDAKSKHKGADPDKLNKGLEEQFQQGLDRKLQTGYKGHLGLGFSKDDKKDSNSTPDGVDAKPDSDVVEERQRVNEDEKEADKSVEKRKTADGGEAATAKKKPMMSFVKASDS